MSSDTNTAGSCPVCEQEYEGEEDATDNKTIPLPDANHICFMDGKVYIHMENENE
ncbi:hypothetical protein PM023_13040 [Halorubrum ezzemoulense]|uniref:hypothetical protein n=1 Tax=Halorubrum ezzemoulense TaxID=337243 RepID=UPI00232AF5F7|nr:hypothetical protein [Halorubrum ezzemoulense]MDB2225595.1 hypothetical protein [Halorubrum ezzemoulense]